MRISTAALLIFSVLMSVHGALAQVQPAQPDPYENRNDFRSAGPITDAERNAPWPSRNQSAETYRDAFCKVWDDGCTRCERDEASRVVTCKTIESAAECTSYPVVCKQLIKTQARVCLMFNDNCNQTSNGNGASTAVLCKMTRNGIPVDTTYYTCEATRVSNYANIPPDHRWQVMDDLAGKWKLTDTRGHSCIVVLNSIWGFSVNDACSTKIINQLFRHKYASSPCDDGACPYTATPDNLTIVIKDPHPRTLRFSIKTPEFPVGLGSIKGWRLTRISTLY